MTTSEELRLLALRLEEKEFDHFIDMKRIGDQILSICLGDEKEQRSFIVGLTEFLTNSYQLITIGTFVVPKKYSESTDIKDFFVDLNEIAIVIKHEDREHIQIWRVRDSLLISGLRIIDYCKVPSEYFVQKLIQFHGKIPL